MAFDTKLMEILACPVCKGKLDYNKTEQELVCQFDKLAYSIEKDIPVLLESEARRICLDEHSSHTKHTKSVAQEVSVASDKTDKAKKVASKATSKKTSE